MIRPLVVLHSLLASNLAAQQPIADTVVSVPFVYEDARIFVPVSVGASAPQWFILDTGAPGVALDAGVARELGIQVADVGRTDGAGPGTLAISQAPDVTVHIGTIPLGPVVVTVAALDSLLAPYGGRGAPGVIGAPFFREHVVELDFASSTMRVYDPRTYQYRGSGFVIPIRIDGDFPTVEGRLVPPRGPAVIPMHLVVDLGAKATMLVNEPFIKAHDLADCFRRAVESPLGAGLGGETRYAFARAQSLSLVDTAGKADAARLDDPVLGMSVHGTLRSAQYDGLVGAEYLHAYRTIFDYAHGMLILEPQGRTRPAEYDMSGMFIVAGVGDRHRFIVQEVLGDGPAARAGLLAGDRIVWANGQSAADLTLGALRNLLRSRSGRDVELMIERDGTTLERTVRLVRLV